MRSLIICLLLLFGQQIFLLAQTPCNSGSANGYACSGVTLQSITSVSALGGSGEGNDIWGWTDSMTGKEYALIGVEDGTSFVDISDSANPLVLGFLPTHTTSSVWRDIKVVNDHAYIVSEAGGHGIQVFDLTRLRTVSTPPATFTADGHSSSIGSAHNIVALEETGYVAAVGAGGINGANGGLVFFDVKTDPKNPVAVGSFGADGYTHDAVCFVYRGPDKVYLGKEICIGYNEDTNTIVDVTDKTDIQLISKTPYTGSQYTHQGWVTDDHKYMLVNDELDESRNSHNTRTYIFDISDLDRPSFIGYYEHPFAAIDHNLYIKGRYAYMANYRSGLRIVDIGDIANGNLVEIAGFDTYQADDNGLFNGAWSNYPYFKSGNVIVSDIEEGLVVVKPEFEHYTFSLDDPRNGVQRVCPGGSVEFVINVEDFGFQGNIELDVTPSAPATFHPRINLSNSTVVTGDVVVITVNANDIMGNPTCVGNFSFELIGNANDGTSTQSIALGIIVDDTLPACTTSAGTCPNCSDGIRNQDEEDIDCGGSSCAACSTCNDRIQNGDEEGIDCGGSACPECIEPCSNPIELSCGSTINDNNANGTNMINAYPAASNQAGYTGPERVYIFTTTTAGPVNISLSNLTADLDMFLFNVCDTDAADIVDYSFNSMSAPENISQNLAAGTYFIFVDGWENAASTYTLSIDCPSERCDDGVQNGNETTIDCGGPDCTPCYCKDFTTIACGQTISSNNASGTNELDTYNDQPQTPGGPFLLPYSNMTGPEQTYILTVSEAGRVEIALNTTEDDLFLYFTDSCNPNGPNMGALLFSGNTIVTPYLTPGNYFIFIDGYNGASGNYDLSINCPQGTCVDDTWNGTETGVDCGGTDCLPCPICFVPKVLLQGAMAGMSMTNSLSSTLPITEPYTALGYSHKSGGGGETTTTAILTNNNFGSIILVA
ncbi:MAG: choice-of-anchor B family protein [Bacteroidota bacterium]